MTRLQVLFVSCAGVGATISEEHNQVNPIRRVVTMLQMMQNKITAEGDKKQAIYDKFMCYCDNADEMLGGAIKAAETKIPMLESSIGEDVAQKAQLEADLKQHAQDQVDAKAAIAKATELRAKEAATYAKESATLKTNIEGLETAIKALGMEGLPGGTGFLQTHTKIASMLRDLSVTLDMSSVDRQLLSSFLATSQGGRMTMAPAMGEINSILQGMLDNMKKDLEEATNNENAGIVALDELVVVKNKEIVAVQDSIESKMVRSGEIAVQHAEQLNDLDDTQEDLAESKKFFADLDVNCAKKKKEWAAYQKAQGEEMLALADTVKVLNDDDSLELFKKTLPAANLLQIKVSTADIKKRALHALKAGKAPADPRMDFLEVALRGEKTGFAKIVKLIDELAAQLKKDQTTDDAKKTYCEAELDKTEDTKKALEQDASDFETMLDTNNEAVANFKVEIEALDDGIRALDKEVAAATESRKEEHEDFTEAAAQNAAAVDLLKFAKNRLNKFYNPSVYKPPPKRELSEEEYITQQMNSLTQVSVHSGAAPPAAPEANLAYATKGEESSGVIRLLDMLINDVETGMQTADLEEKDAQKDYERFMSNAASKRATDSKSMTDKKGALADAQMAVVDGKDKLHSTTMHRMDNEKYLGSLHGECDWLLKNFDVRKEARVDEIEALGNAKAVLNGADYSL
jgi:hypothetical protein